MVRVGRAVDYPSLAGLVTGKKLTIISTRGGADSDSAKLMMQLDAQVPYLKQLGILRPEVGVVSTLVMTGWGKDGRDEAILFVARQADNSLKWHGWMVIKGGFSGARLGGLQPFKDDALGFSLYVPKDAQVTEPTANYVAIFGPQGNGGQPGGAYMTIEPAKSK